MKYNLTKSHDKILKKGDTFVSGRFYRNTLDQHLCLCTGDYLLDLYSVSLYRLCFIVCLYQELPSGTLVELTGN